MIGTSVSHYRIVGKLGAGGMGEVYAAEDELLGRRVAIKIPSAHDEGGSYRRRFEQEARAASRLTDPNVARVYDYGETADGRPFLVMELVAGTSLRQVLQEGRLEPGRAGAVVSGVLRALEAAHAEGLVHRDIKPGNVMLSASGEVKVLDFGLAKEAKPAAAEPRGASETASTNTALTLPGMVAGTPPYMSPEQARGGPVDARSDLFSAGLLLYQCLTGVPAFSGATSREVLEQVRNGQPAPASARVPELAKGWDRILQRALEKDPARRYQSAAEMRAAVEGIGQRTGTVGAAIRETVAGSRRRTAVTAAASLALVAAALVLLRGAGAYRPAKPAAEWYERGATALRDGTFYSAAGMLQKAVDLDPNYALAHARLAEAAAELDDSARASSHMLLALGGKPPGGTAGLYIEAIRRSLTGDFAGAAKAYGALVEKAAGAEKAAALVDLARVYVKGRQPAKAMEAFRAALARDPQNAAAHLQLAELLGRRRDPRYVEEFDRAFALYHALSNTEGEAETLYQRGFVLSTTDPAAARAALEQARDLARAAGSEPQEIAVGLQLGVVSYLLGDMQAAEGFIQAGLERARRAGMNYLAARGMADLGNVQFLKTDYTRAEESYRESLEIARRYGLRRAEARALFGLGNVHETAGPEDAALRELTPALAYYREGGFQIEAALCLLVMGRAYRDLGRGQEAAANFEQAIAAARQGADPGDASIAEQGLASVLAEYGRWPEAAQRYQAARESAAALKDADGVVRCLTGEAGALVQLGRFGEAEKALAEAERAAAQAPGRARLTTYLLQQRASLALSRGRNGEAAALARRAFQGQATPRAVGYSLRCLAGVALARDGRAAAGRALCEPALAGLVPLGDRVATLEARFQWAEILEAQGQDAAALDAAAQASGEAAALADTETGWRVWALRARALRHRGDFEGARQAARQGAQLLAALGWDAAVLKGYSGRADIAAWRRELADGAAR